MSYLQVLVVRPVLEVLDHHLVLEVQGFLWDPENHLPPGALADPADLGNRYPYPPENNRKSVSQKRMRKTPYNFCSPLVSRTSFIRVLGLKSLQNLSFLYVEDFLSA